MSALTTALTEAPQESRARIVRVKGDRRFVSRATSIGLTEGRELEVLQNAKRRPVLVYCRDSAIALDRHDCENILVEVCDGLR